VFGSTSQTVFDEEHELAQREGTEVEAVSDWRGIFSGEWSALSGLGAGM